MRLPILVCAALWLLACDPQPDASTSSSSSSSSGGGGASSSGGGGSTGGGGSSTAGASSTATSSNATSTPTSSSAFVSSSRTGSSTGSSTSPGSSSASSSSASSSSGSPGGAGTFLRVGFYDQHLAVGPDGTMHLTFLDGAAERIHYGSCQANCDDPASWTLIQLTSNAQLGTITAGPYGLGVDTSGRIHLLVSTVTGPGNSANALVYLTCASNCGSVASWTQLDLSTLAPGSNTINTNSTFMVEPNGRVSFLASGQYNSYSAVYLACGGSCTSLGNWSAGVVLNGNPLSAVQDATGVTHVSLRLGDSAANENLIYYARCASNCVTAASWEVSALGFLHRVGDWSTAFAVTPGGRVFMSYNQGEITVNTADNRKMYVNSCAGSTCMDLNSWQGFTVGDLDEGAEGSWLEPDGEGMVLASVSGFELHLRTCAANCGAGASWSGATLVDSSAAMNQSFPPDTGSACMGTSESASWWPGSPTVGVGPRGTVVVHNPDAIVKCPGDPSPDRLPNIGRVISTY